MQNPVKRVEWPTLALIVITYLIWIFILFDPFALHPMVWIISSALTVTFFMSITHEVLHNHPTRSEFVNSLLILFPIAWSLPYERFRDTHLAHHETGELTDPFDDPESWYVPESGWTAFGKFKQTVLHFNNTIAGRMLIGPAIGLGRFYLHEAKLLFSANPQRRYIAAVWLKHILLVAILVAAVSQFGTAPLWQWLAAVYLGHSVLLIRTFLEHQASPDHGERTVIIEKSCPLAFLFLYNSYHFIHHDHPGVPWYRLPRMYHEHGAAFIERNGAYVYRSYGQILRKYFFKAKDPVAHPFLRREVVSAG